MNPFQSIPPKIRAGLYLALAFVGLFLGGCQVIGVTDLWGFTVVKALALLAYVSTAFGFTAAANVTATTSVVDVTPQDVELDDAPVVDDQAGSANLSASLILGAVLLLALLLVVLVQLVVPLVHGVAALVAIATS